jgi:hypothetical protein
VTAEPNGTIAIRALLSEEAIAKAWLVSPCGRRQTERIVRVALKAALELESAQDERKGAQP